MDDRTRSEAPDPSADSSATALRSEEIRAVPAEPDRTGRTLGRFRLAEKLGQGGMGVVYAAEDTVLRRRVALKVLPASVVASPERRRRFLREARSASAVLHPNLAAVFEVGEDGADVFLAMELIQGRTLRALLRERGGPLDLPEALRVGRDLARGLARAHAAGIVHRDLKPDNVMLDGEGQVKILDFGLAKPLAGEGGEGEIATAVGHILGTPGYMAPEQARGQAVDARADVFSFGVVLFELCTGSRPFGGETAVERIIAVDRDPPARGADLRPGLPAALDALLARCLAKRPEDRPASCAEILAALDTPLAAAPPEIRRPRRLLPAALVAGALIAAALAALLLVRRSPLAATPTTPAPRRVCLEGEPGASACTRDTEVVAWCDPEGHPLACCGPGLVPTGADGICGCPPGGTDVERARQRGCPAPSVDREVRVQEAKAKAMEAAIACFTPLIDAGRAKGGEFAATYYVSPEGVLFGARVDRSTVPDPAAQACALGALRRTGFPPPRGEDAGRPDGLGFVLVE